MAEVVSGECVCGFSTEHLTGALMRGSAHSMRACYDCGTLETRPFFVGVDGDNVEFCGKCGQEMTHLYYQNNNKYRCPKCGKTELLLRTTMMVD